MKKEAILRVVIEGKTVKRKASLMLSLLLLSIFAPLPALLDDNISSLSGGFGAQSSVNWWPMFHHDLSHTGYSTSKAPNRNATLWSYTTGGYVDSSPAVVDGRVYIGSGDKKVYALNASTGALIWNYTTGSGVMSSPAVADGRVYIGSGDDKVYALNASTGEFIWSYTTGMSVSSSPAVADGRVYIGSGDKKVYALNASTGEFIWSYTTDYWVYISSPAVAGGKVYIGSVDDNVYALNASTGALIWSYTTGNDILSSPAVADGKVYVGSYDNNVYALNASTGEFIWSYTTGNLVLSSPAVADGRVYIGSGDYKVYALNASTGEFIWSYTTGNPVHSSPAVADGRVYIGSYDNKVYALNASTGALIWNYKTGSWVYISSPAVADGRVYIGSGDKKVYAFGSHDIAITSVTPSTTKAYVGQTVDIDAVAKNEGTEIETFNVTAYYNDTAIQTQTVTSLAPNAETTLTFNWNTTDVVPGYYTIKAIASTVTGETDTEDNTHIDGTVKIIKSPVAFFTYSPTAPLTSETITFNASLSTPDGGTIISYEWNFDDGTPNATGMITTHAYTDNGTYTVTLTVTDDDGLTDTDSQNITVLNRPPIASFTESATSVPTGTMINFNASASYDPDGCIVSYFWDFGDDTNTTGVTASHSYADDGNYTVTLTVTDDDGATDTITSNKTVLNRPPIADANGPYSGSEGSPITFNATGSIDNDGTIVFYEWDWDNDGSYDESSTSPLINHTWPDDFSGTVGLRVTDDDGLTDTDTASVTVQNVAPTVEAGPDQTADEGSTVSFSGSFTDPGWLDTHTIFWDFGDGTNVTDTLTPYHAYGDNGIYTVTLKVTDDDGGLGIDTLQVTVNNVPPTVEAGPDQTVNVGEVVTFSGSFMDPGWLDTHVIFWDFGDGTNMTGVITPTHIYRDKGTYTVSLKVTDDDDGVGMDTLTMTVHLHDIAITSVKPSKTIAGQGYSISISVIVENQGEFTETFNVTAYANTTAIEILENITLTSGNSTTLTFTWNTKGFAKGNYTISAEADTVPGETDAADNTCIGGWVLVTIPGDVNGDKAVNILDCILLSKHFGHINGDGHAPSTRDWTKCMNCDMNSDQRVNILDCIILAGYFGQKWL